MSLQNSKDWATGSYMLLVIYCHPLSHYSKHTEMQLSLKLYWWEGICSLICEIGYCVYYFILTWEHFWSFTFFSVKISHTSHLYKCNILVLQTLLKFMKELFFLFRWKILVLEGQQTICLTILTTVPNTITWDKKGRTVHVAWGNQITVVLLLTLRSEI